MTQWARWLPSKKWLFLPPVLLGVAVVAIMAASRKQLRRVEVSERAVPLTVLRVEPQWVPPTITGFGTASPNRLWSAVAEVGGRIVETHPNLRTGIRVHAGELLLQIDRQDIELRLSQRRADLQQATAELRRLQLNQEADRKSLEIQQSLLEVRRSDVQRLDALRSRSAVSTNEYEGAQAVFLQQQQTVQTLLNTLSLYPASVEAAEAASALAEARIQEAQRDLERSRIVAPFEGLLTQVNLEVGQYVAPGQALFEVIDTSYVEVEAQVSLSQLERLAAAAAQMRKDKEYPTRPTSTIPMENRGATETPPEKRVLEVRGESTEVSQSSAAALSFLEGLEARVIARSGSLEREFLGRPVRLTSTLDQKTRTLGIVVQVDNPAPSTGLSGLASDRLRTGTYCEVVLTATQPVSAYRLPRTAVDEGAVYCLDKNDRLQRRTVEAAFETGEDLAVIGGLEPGVRIVVNPPAGAIEGQLVHPFEVPPVQDQLANETLAGDGEDD